MQPFQMLCIHICVKHENGIFVGHQLVDGATKWVGLHDLASCAPSN